MTRVDSYPDGFSREDIIAALEWALGCMNRPRLIPGQNDDYVAAYNRAQAVLTALKGGA